MLKAKFMPNPFFRFKQFTVYHDRCAMKVGTDGVLLGAWTNVSDSERILDVGSGSGLISLMLAQRNPKAIIHAIDIDKDAIEQTRINIESSLFVDRISSECISLADHVENDTDKYDLIVSNPPFFIDSLKSPDGKRSKARHTDTLMVEDLVKDASELLTAKGKISLIYPIGYKEKLLPLAEENTLFVTRVTDVYSTPRSNPKRVLIELSKEDRRVEESELIIETDRHIYSDQFIDLLRDFYLKF